ncbi:hypothetical protein LINPERPRIM_LOCUS8366 [Linum perenne]
MILISGSGSLFGQGFLGIILGMKLLSKMLLFSRKWVLLGVRITVEWRHGLNSMNK